MTIDQNPPSFQSTINTYSNLYLPVVVVIPSAIAVILTALYLRKGQQPKA